MKTAFNPKEAITSKDVAGLLRKLYDVIRKLEYITGRKFTPDGHLVCSVGEVWAREFFNLELFDSQCHPEHDAKTEDGELVQIKTTQGKSISICREPQKLLALLLKPDGSCETVYNGPGKVVWPHVGKRQKNNQCKVSLSKLRALDETVADSERISVTPRRYSRVAPLGQLPEWKDPIIEELHRVRATMAKERGKFC